MSSTIEMNSIFLGEVASVQTYGAFVKIPGCSNQGLVHRSQISKVNVPEVSDVLAKGDRVWCKVITSNEDGKIGLSMKAVDQGNGKDLDPNGVQAKLDEQKRKEWTPGEKRKAISLEAVYNTTCSKCGTRGHLGKDCFQMAGGKKYELIPEDDIGKSSATTTTADIDLTDKLKDKREKKMLKKEAKRAKKEAKRKKKAAKKLKKKLEKDAKKAKKAKEKKKSHSSSEDSADSSDSSSSSDNDSEKEGRSTASKKRGSHSRLRSRSRSAEEDRKRMKIVSHHRGR